MIWGTQIIWFRSQGKISYPETGLLAYGCSRLFYLPLFIIFLIPPLRLIRGALRGAGRTAMPIGTATGTPTGTATGGPGTVTATGTATGTSTLTTTGG
jgi:hypothetical protein